MKLPKLADKVPFLIGLGLILVVLAISMPLLNRGFFFAHDMLHLARAAELWRALQAGQFPPRWSQNFGFGYGVPLFEFYAPLPYFLAGLLYGLHVPEIIILKLLYLIPNLVSVVGAYLLGKLLSGKKAGFFLAVIFALAPYRALDLFVRGAISESWGIMTFPWILYGISGVLRQLKSAKWILIFACLALFLSHNITTLLFMPLALMYAAIELFALSRIDQRFAKPRELLKSVLPMVGGLTLAAGVSAFYLIPAFLEKQSVQIGFTINDYYQYRNHFLYLRQFFTPFWGYGSSTYGPQDTVSFFLGYGWWLSLAVLLLVFVVWVLNKLLRRVRLSAKEQATLIRTCGWGLLSAISLFMTLGKSALIWSAISPLQFAQFPWRFLGCFAIFSGLTFMGVLSLVSQGQVKTVLVVSLAGVIIATQFSYFRTTPDVEDDQRPYESSELNIKNNLGPSLLEYLPIGMPSTMPVAQTRLKLVAMGSVTMTHDQVGNYEAQISSPQNSQVIWQVSNFPGWQTTLDGKVIAWTAAEQGLLAIPVPAGQHTVGLKWGDSFIRFASDLVSAICLVRNYS